MTLADELRREARDLETALRWAPIPPGMCRNDPALVQVRITVLREVADKLEATQ